MYWESKIYPGTSAWTRVPMSKRKASTSAKAPPTKRRKTTSLANPTSRRLLRAEKKNLDVSINTATLLVQGATTAVGTPLLQGITQGAGDSQHVGRSITMSSFQYRFTGQLATTTTRASSIRILVIYDKQANAAQCTAAQVLTADQLSSPMNLTNNKRFIVISDEIIPCVGTSGPQSFYKGIYKKINLPVEFNTTNGGTIADITTGSMTAFFYTDGSFGVANPETSFYSRIRYSDS